MHDNREWKAALGCKRCVSLIATVAGSNDQQWIGSARKKSQTNTKPLLAANVLPSKSEG
jgi:hypothetical protein